MQNKNGISLNSAQVEGTDMPEVKNEEERALLEEKNKVHEDMCPLRRVKMDVVTWTSSCICPNCGTEFFLKSLIRHCPKCGIGVYEDRQDQSGHNAEDSDTKNESAMFQRRTRVGASRKRRQPQRQKPADRDRQIPTESTRSKKKHLTSGWSL